MQVNSLEQLDWTEITLALADKAQTSLGRRVAITPHFSKSRDEIATTYKHVQEMQMLFNNEKAPPLAAIADVQDFLDRATKGSVLELEELRAVRDLLNAQMDLWRWGRGVLAEAPLLSRLCDEIVIDTAMNHELNEAFDPQGRLSQRRYPILFDLNSQIQNLKSKIQSELDRLVTELGDALQENYITQRNGRFVLPMRSNYKRGFGVAHGRSQSGETVFVEPLSVLPLSNQLQEAESALRSEVLKIRTSLSQSISLGADTVKESNRCCVDIDLICAKTRLGAVWRGVIPTVGEQGVIAVQEALHPILALRGAVVGNDLRLGDEQRALILSGPNAGGKTVALKTFGLFVLLTKMGIPLPAQDGARVDYFEHVFADIGDAQDIGEGLSTFSGHLIRLQQILNMSGPSVLVLLDELGMGTDPVQGAALAQAVVEALVDSGSRVALTTHFTRIKALSTVDERYAVAATQFEDGRPTYRLIWGRVGESHALSLGRRLGMDDSLLKRATELCSEGEQKLSALILKLEEQNSLIEVEQKSLLRKQLELREAKRAHQEEIDKLQRQKTALLGNALEEYQSKLDKDTQRVKNWIKELVANPSVAKAGMTLEKIRTLEQANSKPKMTSSAKNKSPSPSVVLKVGDLVDHPQWGQRLSVIKLMKGGRCQIDVGGMSIVVQRAELCLHSRAKGRFLSQKAGKKTQKRVGSPKVSFSAVRGDVNTCDLRGCRVDEALTKLDFFFDRMVQSQLDVCFVLHGHGSGALKTAVRRHLPQSKYVKDWRPADSHEGGDAFSVVLLN